LKQTSRFLENAQRGATIDTLFLLFNFFSSYLSCFLYLFDLFEFDFILILTSLFFFSFLWITIWNGVGFDMR